MLARVSQDEWEVSEGLKGLTATQLSAGSVGDSALSLTPSQGFCHMLPSQCSFSISLAKSCYCSMIV